MTELLRNAERQRLLAIPGMEELLAERKQAQQAHLDACLRVAPPIYRRTSAMRRRDKNAAVASMVVRSIEEDIERLGGAPLLHHESRRSDIGAVAVTVGFCAWLGLMGVTKNEWFLFSLPLFAAAPVAVVTAYERSR